MQSSQNGCIQSLAFFNFHVDHIDQTRLSLPLKIVNSYVLFMKTIPHLTP